MIRAQILAEYNVENGIIRSPGKFEGEPVYSPYFYEIYLNGCADEDNGELLLFHVTTEDRVEWPELADTQTISLRIDDNGFIYCADEN